MKFLTGLIAIAATAAGCTAPQPTNVTYSATGYAVVYRATPDADISEEYIDTIWSHKFVIPAGQPVPMLNFAVVKGQCLIMVNGKTVASESSSRVATCTYKP